MSVIGEMSKLWGVPRDCVVLSESPEDKRLRMGHRRITRSPGVSGEMYNVYCPVPMAQHNWRDIVQYAGVAPVLSDGDMVGMDKCRCIPF
jgi:hypothetical protein